MLYLVFVLPFLSLLIERWFLNQYQFYSLRCFVLKTLILSVAFLLLFSIFRKPIFSLMVTIALEVLLLLVNHAKYRALRESLVFSDLVLYLQVFKFPRLYFPFLGLPAIIGIVVVLVFVFLSYSLEMTITLDWLEIIVILLFVLSSISIALFLSRGLAITYIPNDDVDHYGLINSLFLYTTNILSSKAEIKSPYLEWNQQVVSKENLPDIISIQSESFFDARRLDANIRDEVLSSYDQIVEDSCLSGHLNVPAWGANTMRTEFSFLTGIKNKALEYRRFYPHYFFQKNPPGSMINLLKKYGYKTICIHPHPAEFFKRKTFFENLGFDRFIDIEEFDTNVDSFGPYVSDRAVSDKVMDVLDEGHDGRPLFIFVITMENHGPLHLESVSVKEYKTYYNKQTENNLDDLTVYLRHLKNADFMIKNLKGALENRKKSALLCFYGDHVPSMPNIYESLSFSDERTNFFIWDSRISNASKDNNKEMSIDELGFSLMNRIYEK